MEPEDEAWSLLSHDGFLRDQRWHLKKRPQEIAAVLRNLQRYMDLLAVSPNPRAIQAGFIHPEPHGMVALDQRGGDGHLRPTRLYCFADERTRIVHLLGIGDKDSQTADLARLAPIARDLNR